MPSWPAWASDFVIESFKGEMIVTPRGGGPADASRCFVSHQAPTAAGDAPSITEGATTYVRN